MCALPVTDFFSFFPNHLRAQRLDQRMHQQLGESIAYLADELQRQLSSDTHALQTLAENLKAGARYSPATFGLYYQATQALLDDQLTQAQERLQQLREQTPIEAAQPSIKTLDQLQPNTKRALYQRLMDTDPNTPFTIVPPPAATREASVKAFESGLRRLHDLIPELAAEFNAIIHEVILVVGDREANGYDFAGGSCYMLWGALFINAEFHSNDVAMIEAIAHESAHSLLFGFTIDEALVENPDEDLYTSPLRDDPRPMDGIYHATFVSARMHWAMSQLLETGQLNSEEVQQARASQTASKRGFFSGYKTVEKFAQMSLTGQALMNNAHQYMTRST